MTPSGYQRYKIQLVDLATGENIITAGGVVQVCTDGSPDKATITDSVGTALSNPLALTRGSMEFHVATTVTQVDLFIQCPGGQFVTRYNVKPSGPNDIYVDTIQRQQTMVVPFSHADSTAATEKDSGFDLPANSIVLPHPTIRVVDVDATETIDVGTLSTESGGDADGFVVTVSVATAGVVKGTVLQGSNTLGALFEVQDSANSGDLTHEPHVTAVATSISYTTTAGSDTVSGFAFLPYILQGEV